MNRLDPHPRCVFPFPKMLPAKKGRSRDIFTVEDDDRQAAPLFRLPAEVLLHIMSFLTFTQRGCLSLACRLFARLGRDRSLWRVVTIEEDLHDIAKFGAFLKAVKPQVIIPFLFKEE